MTLNIRINSRMLFKDPYVIRVHHAESTPSNMKLNDFLEFRKIAKANIKSDWGYSDPEFEYISSQVDMFLTPYATATYNSVACYSYWAFTNLSDALHFKITVDNAVRVHMWPINRKFTLYEYTQ